MGSKKLPRPKADSDGGQKFRRKVQSAPAGSPVIVQASPPNPPPEHVAESSSAPTVHSRLPRPGDLIHQLVAFVGVLTPDGTLIEANEPALEAGGLTKADVLNKKFWDCSWWSHDDFEQRRLRDAVLKVAAGATVRYDAVVRMAGDTLVTIDFMLAPLKDERGRVTHLIPSATDISDRVKAQRQVAEQFAMLEALYTSAPIGLWMLDSHLRFLKANQTLADMTGIPVDQIVGRTLREVYPGVADSAEVPARRVLDTGEPVLNHRVEGRLDDDPEQVRSWNVSYVPLRDDAGRLYAISASAFETTQGERDRAALQDAKLQAERDQREIEAIYQNVPVGLCVLDRELHWLRINERLAEINGMSVEAHRGKTVTELLPTVAPSVRKFVDQVLATGEPILDIEIAGQTPAQPGVNRVWQTSYTPVFDESGTTVAVNVITKEITEQKRAQAKLREALQLAERRQAELESIHAVSPAGLSYHDADLTIRYINPKLEAINGVPNAKLVGKNPSELGGTLAAQVVPLMQRVVLTGEPVVNEQVTWNPPYDPDTPHHFLVNYGPVWRGEGANRVVAGVMASVVDISEIVESRRKLESWTHRLEEEVATRTHEVVEQNRRLHRLGEEVMNAQNRERRRVARILHDDLQQTLTAARIDADVLAMRNGEPDDVATSLRDLLAEACDTARNLSHELYPAVLSTHGLGEALRWLAKECEVRFKLKIECDLQEAHWLSVQVQAFLYDVARELLFNVHKHAETDRARLELVVTTTTARLSVVDDGKGCDERLLLGTDGGNANSMGLPLIRHRLELLQGSLRVAAGRKNKPASGCRIAVELPIKPRKSAVEPSVSPVT